MTGSNVLPEKDLLEKAPIVKRFEYWPLGKGLKVQTDITKKKKKKKKQYQRLDNTFDFGKTIKKEKPTLKKYNRSNVTYDSKYSFHQYCNIKNFNSLPLVSNYPCLFSFYSELNKCYIINPQKEWTKDKKALVYDNVSELYNENLEIYFKQDMTFSDAKKRKLGHKYHAEKLFLEGYDCSVQWENKEESIGKEESTDKEESVDFSDMPPLEVDEEELRDRKGLKILTPNKLLTRLLILLSQIKQGNNSYKLENE